MVSNKKNVLFVGGFDNKNGKVAGGQLHACTTLLESEITKHIDFTLIDSTMESLPPPRLYRRGYLAIKRIITFTLQIISNHFDAVFIFAGHGVGFIEKGLMVIISRVFRTKVVLSPRSGFLLEEARASSFMRHYVRLIFSMASILMCQGEIWVMNYQNLTNTPKQKFKVVPNWIEADVYLNLVKTNNTNSKTNILFMGWIEKEKGIFDLISAVSKNRDAFRNVNFIIAGHGSQLDRIKEEVKTIGISNLFKFPGWVKGQYKFELLAEADIFVLPSHAEGMPNALLESMASGCAVIVSSVGAIPEVVQNEVNGILVKPGDINALGDSLERVVADKKLCKQLATAAKQSISEKHNISNIWPRVNELF